MRIVLGGPFSVKVGFHKIKRAIDYLNALTTYYVLHIVRWEYL